MVDSTDFRTRGNENAASIIQSLGVDRPTCRTKYGVRCETWTDWILISRETSRLSHLSRAVVLLQAAQKGRQQGRSR
jgi:hypothetical protein